MIEKLLAESYPRATMTDAEYRAVLESARNKLTNGQKASIDELAAQLVRRVKQRNQRAQISTEGALEILAAIGQMLNKGKKGANDGRTTIQG